MRWAGPRRATRLFALALASAALWLGATRRAPEAGEPPAPRGPSPVPMVVVAALLLATTAGWIGVRAWTRAQEQVAVARALTGGDPDRGAGLITRYGCGGCHAVPGVPGADGRVAAPLGGLRERVFVGGVLRNTPANLVAWIVAPRRFSPETAMPATGITEAEARDVAAFLYSR